jgi:hypothetical protein
LAAEGILVSEDDQSEGQAVAATSDHDQEVRSSTVTLHVFVRDQGGGALAEARVGATSQGRSVGSGITDGLGMATLAVPRGRVLDLRARFDPGRGSDPRALNRRAFGQGSASITATDDPTYATLFVPRPHRLARPFPWQNEVIRRTIYRDDGDNDDPGTQRVRGATLADRKQRLLEVIDYARQFLPSPPGPPGNETPALRQDRQLAERASERRRSSESDYDAASHRVPHIRTTEIPAVRNRHARTAAEREQRREEIRQLRQERRELIADLPRLRAERERARETDREAQHQRSESERQALGSLSHDELVRYVIDQLFAADPSSQHLPPWVRYLILHYTGFRYAVAHRSYYPPQWLAFNLQSYRIEQGESALSEAQLDHALGEIRALMTRDAEFGARIERHLGYFVRGQDRVEAGGGARRKRRLRPTRPTRFDPSAVLEAATTGRPPRRADRRYRQGTKAAAVSDLQKAMAHARCLQATTAEAMGLLKHQRAEGVLEHQDDKWHAAVKHTHLRCDEVTGDDWQDVEYRRFSNPWRGIFGDNTQRQWGEVNAEDLSITVIRCECNEIAEIAGAARGVAIGGRGLRGDADQLDDAPAAAAEEQEDDSSDGSPEEPGSPVAEHAHDHRLFRIERTSELRPGDVMFHITWSAIPSLGNADPGKCAALGLDMAYMAGRSDPIEVDRLSYADEIKLQRGRDDPPRLEQPPESHALYAYAYVKPSRQDVRMIVRRSDPHFTKFDEYLRFSHIFTIVAVTDRFAYTFETNAPVGMKRRPQSQLAAWDYVVARPGAPDAATQQALSRRLAPYLDRSRLLLRRR